MIELIIAQIPEELKNFKQWIVWKGELKENGKINKIPITPWLPYGFRLDACLAGFFNAAASFYPPMQDALELPAGHKSFGAMMLGYPEFKYHRIPLRITPKNSWR